MERTQQQSLGWSRFTHYFRQAKEIKTLSKRLVAPDILVDTQEPLIMETRIFDMKWDKCAFPAGFHSFFLNSYRFNNAFAERLRYDKATTTSASSINEIVKINTVRKGKRRWWKKILKEKKE
jgi:hypothetical protein